MKVSQALGAAALATLAIGMALLLSRPARGEAGDKDDGKHDHEVVVVNTSAHPVPVQDVGHGASVPFQTTLTILSDQVGANGVPQSFAVPAGKRLTIEYVTMSVLSQTSIQGTIQTTAGGSQVTYKIPLASLGGPAGLASNTWGAAQVTRIYADGGTNVTLSLFREVAVVNDQANLEITLSGTLTPE